MDAPAKWVQADAIALCREVELLAPRFGCHVALTGGTLYKAGERKDADLLFYRIRQEPLIDREGLLASLKDVLGVEVTSQHGWVVKAIYQGKTVDMFFPETPDGEYHG